MSEADNGYGLETGGWVMDDCDFLVDTADMTPDINRRWYWSHRFDLLKEQTNDPATIIFREPFSKDFLSRGYDGPSRSSSCLGNQPARRQSLFHADRRLLAPKERYLCHACFRFVLGWKIESDDRLLASQVCLSYYPVTVHLSRIQQPNERNKQNKIHPVIMPSPMHACLFWSLTSGACLAMTAMVGPPT